ncbi:MAG: hypothetical protein KGZ65_07910 [Sphingomonadales bacterium]|nr:hypothetical protein [Sphingomonadaceae bacterium]MBS3931145.1 hypothetical protein [Sphingomonadales bacterium]
MREVEAIKTVHNGISFRSRTEARWAVFFDTLGLSFEYEKTHFDLPDSQRYLPDFFLPELNAWFEVKAENDAIVTEEAYKARLLAASKPGIRVWLAIGPPRAEIPNILTLDDWDVETPIEEILATSENRYRFLEDRRDKLVFWLQADSVTGGFRHSFMAGGPGTNTDHDRLPLLHGSVAIAYEKAMVQKW